MASQLKSALSTITSAISKFRIVSPFKVPASRLQTSIKQTSALSLTGFMLKKCVPQITGVASSSEFKPYLDNAPDYRSHAPGSQPVRAIVPHADEDRVYNIKYYDRDTRREHMLVGGTNKTHLVTREIHPVEPTHDPFEGLPPRPGKAHKWGKAIPYLEFENNGYT